MAFQSRENRRMERFMAGLGASISQLVQLQALALKVPVPEMSAGAASEESDLEEDKDPAGS